MVLRRRLSFLRAAAVGGAGYAIGKRVRVRRWEVDGIPDPVPLDDLRKLGDLRNEGVLTDDEFDMQKARLLQGA